jgi:ribosomal protein L37AE/L43A
MMEASEEVVCIFCGKPTIPARVRRGDVIVYECRNCKSPLAAYMAEYHDILRSLFLKKV